MFHLLVSTTNKHQLEKRTLLRRGVVCMGVFLAVVLVLVLVRKKNGRRSEIPCFHPSDQGKEEGGALAINHLYIRQRTAPLPPFISSSSPLP